LNLFGHSFARDPGFQVAGNIAEAKTGLRRRWIAERDLSLIERHALQLAVLATVALMRNGPILESLDRMIRLPDGLGAGGESHSATWIASPHHEPGIGPAI
jgi:hypothetical protein